MAAANCIKCDALTSKYKCVKCFGRICSLPCMTAHKNEQQCQPRILKIEDESNNTVYHETDDSVPKERLLQLGDSEEIRNALKSPDLRQILTSLDQSPDPSRAFLDAMKHKEFADFADECLKIADVNVEE